MATKTISLDMEAHGRLRAVGKPNESFSDVIKRVVRLPLDVDRYLYRMEKEPMSDKAARAVREHIDARHTSSRRQ